MDRSPWPDCTEPSSLPYLDGGPLRVEGRAWGFAQEEGCTTGIGDRLTLVGFVEGGEVETGAIHDLTAETGVILRDDAGRPLWSGRGKTGA